MQGSAEVVICGAGIVGVGVAFFLARRGLRDVLLVDQGPPLELTSSRSTECYRNWWPDPAMVALMNRSIDLLEALANESGNVFRMNRRGYLYVTGDEHRIPGLMGRARLTAGLGAGTLRIHTSETSSYAPADPEGYLDAPGGADLLLGGELIQRHYPFLTDRAVAALHVRRAGWLSAQQLGMHLLDQARRLGVKFVRAQVSGLSLRAGRIEGVQLADGTQLGAGNFVNAAGPFLRQVGRLAGTELPVHTELHLKAAFKDHLGVIERGAPLLIWDDPQRLPWDPEERTALSDDLSSRWLTAQFPGGAHTRPEGGPTSDTALMLWEYKSVTMEPVWPPPLDPSYPEVVLRGLATMLPGLRRYFDRAPRPQLDGGYYTKTPENRPLVGPMGIPGAFVAGALGGYGIMAACAVGDLLAAHLAGGHLPDYAAAFGLARYEDPAYRESLQESMETGQL